MEKALELEIRGIDCDACDFKDETVALEEFQHWLNKPCPECGENLLTEVDFDNVKMLVQLSNLINQMSPETHPEEKKAKMEIEMNGTGKMNVKIEEWEEGQD